LAALEAVHDPAYLARLRESCEAGNRFLDEAQTPVCPDTFHCARLGSGAAIAGCDAVMAGLIDRAFCAVRPPGHHAEHGESMGFCFVNHAAVAAQHLIDQHNLERVAIIDFDIHHGNGTQHIFEDRADVLFISIHQHPSTLYPGTGFIWETGTGPGKGATLNLPVEPGAGDTVYRALMNLRVWPTLKKFQPEFLVLSSGFDAAKDDPLGTGNVTEAGFRYITRKLADAADELCGGRLVSILEGGYDPRALAVNVAAHIDVLAEDAPAYGAAGLKAGF
jgi:acetoin utilization deacetylase AcuC-like enzyme